MNKIINIHYFLLLRRVITLYFVPVVCTSDVGEGPCTVVGTCAGLLATDCIGIGVCAVPLARPRPAPLPARRPAPRSAPSHQCDQLRAQRCVLHCHQQHRDHHFQRQQGRYLRDWFRQSELCSTCLLSRSHHCRQHWCGSSRLSMGRNNIVVACAVACVND